LMESVKDSRDVETRKIKTKRARGMSVRACMARAMTWELKLANDTTVHDTRDIKESLPQAMCEAKPTPN
jgi:hypothetical protein